MANEYGPYDERMIVGSNNDPGRYIFTGGLLSPDGNSVYARSFPASVNTIFQKQFDNTLKFTDITSSINNALYWTDNNTLYGRANAPINAFTLASPQRSGSLITRFPAINRWIAVSRNGEYTSHKTGSAYTPYIFSPSGSVSVGLNSEQVIGDYPYADIWEFSSPSASVSHKCIGNRAKWNDGDTFQGGVWTYNLPEPPPPLPDITASLRCRVSTENIIISGFDLFAGEWGPINSQSYRTVTVDGYNLKHVHESNGYWGVFDNQDIVSSIRYDWTGSSTIDIDGIVTNGVTRTTTPGGATSQSMSWFSDAEILGGNVYEEDSYTDEYYIIGVHQQQGGGDQYSTNQILGSVKLSLSDPISLYDAVGYVSHFQDDLNAYTYLSSSRVQLSYSGSTRPSYTKWNYGIGRVAQYRVIIESGLIPGIPYRALSSFYNNGQRVHDFAPTSSAYVSDWLDFPIWHGSYNDVILYESSSLQYRIWEHKPLEPLSSSIPGMQSIAVSISNDGTKVVGYSERLNLDSWYEGTDRFPTEWDSNLSASSLPLPNLEGINGLVYKGSKNCDVIVGSLHAPLGSYTLWWNNQRAIFWDKNRDYHFFEVALARAGFPPRELLGWEYARFADAIGVDDKGNKFIVGGSGPRGWDISYILLKDMVDGVLIQPGYTNPSASISTESRRGSGSLNGMTANFLVSGSSAYSSYLGAPRFERLKYFEKTFTGSISLCNESGSGWEYSFSGLYSVNTASVVQTYGSRSFRAQPGPGDCDFSLSSPVDNNDVFVAWPYAAKTHHIDDQPNYFVGSFDWLPTRNSSFTWSPRRTKYIPELPIHFISPTSQAGASASVPWPYVANVGSGGWPKHEIGDLGLLYVATANQSSSVPAGWAHVSGSPQGVGPSGSAGSTGLSIYWKRATSDNEPNVSLSIASGSYSYSAIVVVKGASLSSGSWLAGYSAGVKSDALATASLASFTATGSNNMLIAGISRGVTGVGPKTSGWTSTSNQLGKPLSEAVDGGTAAGVGGGLSIATSSMFGTSTGTITVQHTVPTSASYIMLAIKPEQYVTTGTVVEQHRRPDTPWDAITRWGGYTTGSSPTAKIFQAQPPSITTQTTVSGMLTPVTLTDVQAVRANITLTGCTAGRSYLVYIALSEGIDVNYVKATSTDHSFYYYPPIIRGGNSIKSAIAFDIGVQNDDLAIGYEPY